MQINDVKDNARFAAAVDRIKSQVLLRPAAIGDPVIAGQRPHTKKVPPHYQNPWGGDVTVYIVSINFPYRKGFQPVFGVFLPVWVPLMNIEPAQQRMT